MPENFRPHLVMGIIIFILALVLIVLTFIPRPPVQIVLPEGGSSGQVIPSNPQLYTHRLLAISLLTLPAM